MLERIGVNLLYLVPGQVGGTEIYARRLLAALAAQAEGLSFTVFCAHEAHESLSAEDWPANVSLARVGVRAAVKPLRLAAELAVLPLRAARARVQVLHSFGTTAPLATRAARVVTIHDLIYEHFPETFPVAARLGLKALVPLGARRSHRVVVPSEATKSDVVRSLGVEAGKVDVVLSGPGMRTVERPSPEAELRKRFELGDAPVVLTVSAALAHKNLDRLLEAFARLERDRAPVLVLVGHAGRDRERLERRAAELGLDARVRITGWIEARELEGLYRLAACFAYPSLYEGFGLPVLEAMARGVPVACSNTTSLPEVAGDAAELFDPLDMGAIARSLDALLGDPARAAELAERGRERAARFSWDAAARGVLASYERAWAAAGRP